MQHPNAHIAMLLAFAGALFTVACGDDDPGADAAVGNDAGSPEDAALNDDGGGQGDAGALRDGGGQGDGGGASDGGWAHPLVTDTWQWQLTGTLNTTYDVDAYDIDLFDVPEATITSLKAIGRLVVCYFSAGSAEDWRPDYSSFVTADLGSDLDGWPGEQWVDIRSSNVRAIMEDRLDLAVQKGCQAVEPDNVDAYSTSTGFPLTAQDQLDYNRWVAAQAHLRALAVGLKNDLDQVLDLVDDFDFAVNEECHDYTECDLLQPFLDAGKPVWNAEYADTLGNAQTRAVTLCPLAQTESLRTLILPWDLDDSFRVSCD